jgi:hypothetical protein
VRSGIVRPPGAEAAPPPRSRFLPGAAIGIIAALDLAPYRGAGLAQQPDSKRLPMPGVLDTFIAPRCSLTISRTVASLNPLPVGRVVKNGSKIRSMIAPSMPFPASLTAIRT